jgi:hypothetical protein
MDCLQNDCRKNILKNHPDQLVSLLDQHLNLKHAMDYLDEGLQNHQSEEEDILPTLIGNILIEAIRIEHLEMLNQLHEIKDDLTNMNTEDFLRNSSRLKAAIDNLCQLINSNTSEEDVILRMLRRHYA